MVIAGVIIGITEAITATTERDTAVEKAQSFNPNIQNFSGPEKDQRKAAETGQSTTPVSTEKGAALMLRGERETFGF